MARNTYKRRILKHIPYFSRLIRALNRLEDENNALRIELEKAVFIRETEKFDTSDINEGIPVPPDILRFWVAGTDNREWFLNSGKQGFNTITQILRQHGLEIAELESILDFGCGCGRILRHLKSYSNIRIHGTDMNQTAIRWCDANLNFAEFGTNNCEPPLRYHDNSFDLVYSFSVFTHLTEEVQMMWIKEIHRILKPGGNFLFSVHGDFYLHRLSGEKLELYKQGRLIVLEAEREGNNVCMAYHPYKYVREMMSGDLYNFISFHKEGALGNPNQDAYLFKKK
jgi:SAM-dependent methyltransferase